MPKKKTSRGGRRLTRRPKVPRLIEQPDSPTRDLDQSDATTDAAERTRTVQKALTVVGVGASAGGLEAFSQTLEHVNGKPGLAFVFVQHLSPQHGSALVELLSPRTRRRSFKPRTA